MSLDALGWNEFHVAMLGATAALAGLVIVAASVNIETIVKATTITSRLAAAIAGLLLALVVSGVALIPGLSIFWFGICILATAVPVAAFQYHATAVIARDRSPAARDRFGKSVLGWLPIAAYATAGILAATGVEEPALILAAVGAITAIVSAVVVSWVALVEVLR